MGIAAGLFTGLLCVLMAAVGGMLRSQYERKRFVTETFCVYSEKIQKETTLVFLTDLHNQVFGAENKPLIEEIDRIHPDYILSGGDAMVVKGERPNCSVPLALFRELSKRYPIVCANGNHETRMRQRSYRYGEAYADYQKKLKSMGIQTLVSGSCDINEWITVSTVELEDQFYRDFIPAYMKKEYLERKLGKADESKFQIMLMHSPLFFRACRRWGADLTLSGHFHGGTIRLPILGGVMTPQYQFFHPKCAGFFQKKGKYLLVGRGLGTHSINIRIGNLPQLVVIRLLPKSSKQDKV